MRPGRDICGDAAVSVGVTRVRYCVEAGECLDGGAGSVVSQLAEDSQCRFEEVTCAGLVPGLLEDEAKPDGVQRESVDGLAAVAGMHSKGMLGLARGALEIPCCSRIQLSCQVTTEIIFSLAGPSAADERYDLSRHWRNARTHPSHDPVSWKDHHVGNYLLNDVLPPHHGQL